MARPKVATRRLSSRVKRSPVGAPPGTLVADPAAPQPTLCLTALSPDGVGFFDDVSIDEIRRLRAEWPLVWVDCIGLGNVDLIQDIGTIFGLHPLALEDTVNTGQRPKADFFDDHAYVVVNMIDDPQAHRYEQISLFFGDDFVVTFQEREGDPFGPVRKRIQSATAHRLRTRKADYLAYALIDAVVDSYFPILDAGGDTIERIEDEMLGSVHKRHLPELHELRRDMIVLKRALWPLRDAAAGLMRAEVPFVHQETRVYLNDTLDHSIRLIEIVETNRDVVTGLIDMHLSLMQARTNDVISFLTIISSIFIPLTFLVGIWGMNFDTEKSPWNMPELGAYYGYPLALGFMVLVAISLVGYFRWKKWL
jgi:magnesium transporter